MFQFVFLFDAVSPYCGQSFAATSGFLFLFLVLALVNSSNSSAFRCPLGARSSQETRSF
jgi:hypothetical protein